MCSISTWLTFLRTTRGGALTESLKPLGPRVCGIKNVGGLSISYKPLLKGGPGEMAELILTISPGNFRVWNPDLKFNPA